MSMRRKSQFVESWLLKSIDGQKVNNWLAPNPSCPSQAICKICPASGEGEDKSFSVKEGFSAVVKHAEGKKHSMYMEEVLRDPNHNRFKKGEK